MGNNKKLGSGRRFFGAMKVLDFGLAKALEPTGAMSPGLSQAPTITTPAMTQTGMIIGTAAYMSPEQVVRRQTNPSH